jgi:hypothetical protein
MCLLKYFYYYHFIHPTKNSNQTKWKSLAKTNGYCKICYKFLNEITHKENECYNCYFDKIIGS